MRNILLLLFMVLVSNKSYAECDFFKKLSFYQQDIAYQAYRIGFEHDLGLTAVAIAWQESKLGKYKIRVGKGSDVSVGIGQTAVVWKTKGMSAFNRGRWVQSMIEHDAKSINVMMTDILHWQRVKGNWRAGIMGYNAGYGSNTQYRDEVVSLVKQLKYCEF